MASALRVVRVASPLLVVLTVLRSLGWLGLAELASLGWVGQRLRRSAGAVGQAHNN